MSLTCRTVILNLLPLLTWSSTDNHHWSKLKLLRTLFHASSELGQKNSWVLLPCMSFPGCSDGRVHLQCGRPVFDPWVGTIPWRREWLPSPEFWPGEFHKQRSLAGCIMHVVAKSQTQLSNCHFTPCIMGRHWRFGEERKTTYKECFRKFWRWWDGLE